MESIQLHSKVGRDGVLELRVPLGRNEADREVVVTIQSLPGNGDLKRPDRPDWHTFINQTYGSCAGLGLERHQQGEYEHRDPIA